MKYLGDIAEDATVHFMFTTNDREGAAVAPSSAFEAADILIYKDNGATQKATANGITMTSPFDSVTGLHAVTIDTSVDTGDTGFWATGSNYICVLSPDETVDAKTVVSIVASFSIQNRYMRGTDSAALDSGVIVTTNNDKTGYRLDATGSAAMTESYAADGATGTLAQILYEIKQFLTEKNIAATTLTVKKLDGSTTAATYTLDSATTPTTITRAS